MKMSSRFMSRSRWGSSPPLAILRKRRKVRLMAQVVRAVSPHLALLPLRLTRDSAARGNCRREPSLRAAWYADRPVPVRLSQPSRDRLSLHPSMSTTRPIAPSRTPLETCIVWLSCPSLQHHSCSRRKHTNPLHRNAIAKCRDTITTGQSARKRAPNTGHSCPRYLDGRPNAPQIP